MNLVIFFLWIFYAVWEGLREGVYWEVKGLMLKTGYLHNRVYYEHIEWTIQRSCVLALTFFASDWIIAACCVFVFPFFHDGAYYTKRNRFNKNLYRKKWFDQSTTSSAVLTKFFTPVVRTICATIGIGIAIWTL